MGRYLSVLVAGLLFGFGLAISQMTHADKVLGFLDVAGNWDPSLLFVLGGAVGVTAIAFRFILRRPAPRLEAVFQLPPYRSIDAPLVVGALAFGAGWGISGYCPGPGITLLAAPAGKPGCSFPRCWSVPCCGACSPPGLPPTTRSTWRLRPRQRPPASFSRGGPAP